MGTSAIFGGNRYLVPFNRGIATTSVRTGLAMTGNLEPARQTPICRLPRGAHGRIVNYLFKAPGFFAGNWENSLFTILMLCDTMYLVEDGV